MHRKPDLLLSNVETTVAAKFRELQHLFPEGDVVSMVERDATVLFYDFEKSINVKVRGWDMGHARVSVFDCAAPVDRARSGGGGRGLWCLWRRLMSVAAEEACFCRKVNMYV